MRRKCDCDNRGYALDALARRMERNAEIDDLRWANAAKRRAWTGGAARLDDTLKSENGRDKDDAYLSDNGRSVEAMVVTIDGERGGTAAWLIEFRRVVASLDETERRIVATLSEDFRPQAAARLAATYRQKVYRTLAKLRTELATAHTLWKSEVLRKS